MNGVSTAQSQFKGNYYIMIPKIIWLFRLISKLLSVLILFTILICFSTYYRRDAPFGNEHLWFFPLAAPPTLKRSIPYRLTMEIIYNQTPEHIHFLCSNGRPQLWPRAKEHLPYNCWWFIFNSTCEKVDDIFSDLSLNEYGYTYIRISQGNTLIIYDNRLCIKNSITHDNQISFIMDENRTIKIQIVKQCDNFESILQKYNDNVDLLVSVHNPSLVTSRSVSISIQYIKHNYVNVLVEN